MKITFNLFITILIVFISHFAFSQNQKCIHCNGKGKVYYEHYTHRACNGRGCQGCNYKGIITDYGTCIYCGGKGYVNYNGKVDKMIKNTRLLPSNCDIVDKNGNRVTYPGNMYITENYWVLDHYKRPVVYVEKRDRGGDSGSWDSNELPPISYLKSLESALNFLGKKYYYKSGINIFVFDYMSEDDGQKTYITSSLFNGVQFYVQTQTRGCIYVAGAMMAMDLSKE
jgi:hypothetical protein